MSSTGSAETARESIHDSSQEPIVEGQDVDSPNPELGGTISSWGSPSTPSVAKAQPTPEDVRDATPSIEDAEVSQSQPSSRKRARRANSAPQPTGAAGFPPPAAALGAQGPPHSQPVKHYYSPQWRPSAAGLPLQTISPQYIPKSLPTYAPHPQTGANHYTTHDWSTPSPQAWSTPPLHSWYNPAGQTRASPSAGAELGSVSIPHAAHGTSLGDHTRAMSRKERFTANNPFSHNPKPDKKWDDLTFDDIPTADDGPSAEEGPPEPPRPISPGTEPTTSPPHIPRPSTSPHPHHTPPASPHSSTASEKGPSRPYEMSLPSTSSSSDLEALIYVESPPIWPRVYGFTFVTLPRQIYLTILLRIPAMYFSRVARIFEETDLTLPEMKRLALEVGSEGMRDPYAFDTPKNLPHQFQKLKFTWESFIDSVMREWKIANIITVLLLSAILTILQIDAAANDPISRYTALASLLCALISLLFGGMYIVRFGSMRKINRAAEWSLEAKKTKTVIWWNVWIMLAMPAVWLTWSILLYIACIMSFVWRTGPLSDVPPLSLSHRNLLIVRIVLSAVFGLGILYGMLILGTFSRYGDAMDQKWKRRIDGWLLEKAPKPKYPHARYPYDPLPPNPGWGMPHSTWGTGTDLRTPYVYSPSWGHPYLNQPNPYQGQGLYNHNEQPLGGGSNEEAPYEDFSRAHRSRSSRPPYARGDDERYTPDHVSKRPYDWRPDYHSPESTAVSGVTELEKNDEPASQEPIPSVDSMESPPATHVLDGLKLPPGFVAQTITDSSGVTTSVDLDRGATLPTVGGGSDGPNGRESVNHVETAESLKSSHSVQSLDDMGPPALTVIPLLRYEDSSRPPIRWNMEKSPFNIYALKIPLNSNDIPFMSKPATDPPVTSLRLYHPRLPWYVDVSPTTTSHIQLVDIVGQLYEQLHTPIVARHYWNEVLDEFDRAEIARAFGRRTKGKSDLYGKGVMQIDYLDKYLFFEGLVKGPNGRWEIKLATKTEIRARERTNVANEQMKSPAHSGVLGLNLGTSDEDEEKNEGKDSGDGNLASHALSPVAEGNEELASSPSGRGVETPESLRNSPDKMPEDRPEVEEAKGKKAVHFTDLISMRSRANDSSPAQDVETSKPKK